MFFKQTQFFIFFKDQLNSKLLEFLILEVGKLRLTRYY